MRHARPLAVRSLAVVLCAALTALGGGAVAAEAPHPDGGEPSVAGPRDELPEEPLLGTAAVPQESDRLLVRFADGVPASERGSALRRTGGRPVDTVAGTGFVAVETGSGRADEALAALADDPRVADVQVDHVRSATALPDGPFVDYTLPYLGLVTLPRAWDETVGAGAVIAVVDTGVDLAHPELAGRVVPGRDVVDGDAVPDASDGSQHGTGVAGVAMARGDDGVGIGGAAWGASVMPVRVLDGAGVGSDSDVAEGIVWAADHGADVINLSLGGPAESPVLLAAVQHAVARGSVVVAAAGNQTVEGVLYPAAYADRVDGMLAVTATDDDGALAPFSSWGEGVSLAAPGTDIVAPRSGGGYVTASGTSFAAPIVSGAAALLVAGRSPAAVEAALTSSARDAGPRGTDPYYGSGILDTAGALGLGRAVPLDRVAGDPGPDDSTPARARPLAVGTETRATLAPEGDEDWYAVQATARGWYRVTVQRRTEDVWAGPNLRPALSVVGAAGQVLGSVEAASFATGTVTLDVPVTAPGPLRIGVRNVTGTPVGAGYRVVAQRLGAVHFSAAEVPAQDGSDGAALATGDVTGDGVPDVLGVASWAAVLRIHPGVGDGTLAPVVEVPLGGATVGWRSGIGLLDADRDGDTDVVVGTGTGYVLLERTAQGLVARPPVRLAGPVWALRVADMDGDGLDDVVVSVDGGTTRVHRSTGDGRFAPGADVGVYLSAFALADVSGDGRTDLVAADGQVHLQRPDGSLAPTGAAAAVPEVWGGRDVALADVTGDGRLDVVRTEAGHVDVAAGAGDGTFAASVRHAVAPYLSNVRVGDLDGDGRLDVVVAEWASRSVWSLRQRADGTLEPAQAHVAWVAQIERDVLELGDLNRDGRLDAVVLGGSVLQTLRQDAVERPGALGAWVLDTAPARHAAGVPERPTVTVTTGRDVDPSSVSAATVRLVDGTTGADVPATRSFDRATRVLAVTPSAPLAAGHHHRLVVAGLRDTAGNHQARTVRTWFTVGAGGDRFTPVAPFRVLDTRDGTGGWVDPVSPGEPIQLELGGVEVPPEATAVVLNVTAVAGTGGGNVRVYPTPQGPDVPPLVSNLNLVPGVDQPNAVTVALGVDGRVSLATDGLTAHLVADIAGYYSPGGATAYVPSDPVRVLDTRNGTGGVPVRPVPADGWVDVVVAGRNGVPAEASAVVLNVTGTDVAGGTNVRVYPAPADSEWQEPPTVSSLNLQPHRDQANLVTVAVGDGGRVRLYTQTAAVHLIADLAGYYSATGDHGFVPVEPTRVVDTRSGLGSSGRLVAGRTRTVTTSVVPDTAAAVVMNVTGVAPAGKTNVRVFPARSDGSVPLVSNLNLVAGRTEPNLAVVRLGAGRAFSVFSETTDMDVVIDVAGYFRR